MIDSAKSHIFFLIWLSLYYLLTTTIFFSRNFSPNFQCAMTSYCRIFCDNLTLTNLQYFNQSLMNDRYSNILNEKEIKLCCLLKANFSTKANMQINRVCQHFDTPSFPLFCYFLSQSHHTEHSACLLHSI